MLSVTPKYISSLVLHSNQTLGVSCGTLILWNVYLFVYICSFLVLENPLCIHPLLFSQLLPFFQYLVCPPNLRRYLFCVTIAPWQGLYHYPCHNNGSSVYSLALYLHLSLNITIILAECKCCIKLWEIDGKVNGWTHRWAKKYKPLLALLIIIIIIKFRFFYRKPFMNDIFLKAFVSV